MFPSVLVNTYVVLIPRTGNRDKFCQRKKRAKSKKKQPAEPHGSFVPVHARPRLP